MPAPGRRRSPAKCGTNKLQKQGPRVKLEEQLNTKLAEAEKIIDASKQAAMANVRNIAADAAKAIVERLIGTTPADSAVAAAVKDAQKLTEKTMELLRDPETWVAVAFVIFLGVLAYLGAHKMIMKSLDDRADRIKAELGEARRLKDEAAELLAEYQRKRQAAEAEAQDIIEGAKAEADRLATEAKGRIEDFVARRTALAETDCPGRSTGDG